MLIDQHESAPLHFLLWILQPTISTFTLPHLHTVVYVYVSVYAYFQIGHHLEKFPSSLHIG